jgi:hypothetical protein
MPPVPARIVRVVLVCGVALSLAACGSGAVDSPDAGGTTPNHTGGTPNNAGDATPQNPGNGAATDYDRPWEPPKGDESVQAFEGRAVNYLHDGDCDGARRFIDGTGEDGPAWQGFSSPRNLLLFEAGIALCRHDTVTATRWYGRAKALGWAGTVRDGGEPDANMCPLYQAVASVVENRPKDAFTCQPGAPPEWKVNETTLRYDDPRTPEDESATTDQPSGDTVSPTEVPQ